MFVVTRKTAVGALCAAAAIAAPAAAQAGQMNVTAAITAQDKVVKSSSAYKDFKKASHQKTSTAKAAALVKSIPGLVRTFDHAASVVNNSSTSTAQQKQGKQDWVRGVREGAKGFARLEVEFKDVEAGKKAAAKVALQQGEKLYNAGNKLAEKGDKLLGLPTSD